MPRSVVSSRHATAVYRTFAGRCLLGAALAALAAPLVAQDAYTPSAENLKAREWFQDARFGLFIHWGVYSVLGDGEWVMQNQRLTIPSTSATCRPRSTR